MKILSLLLIISFPAAAMIVKHKNLSIPEQLGKLAVLCDAGKFRIKDHIGETAVEAYKTDRFLRGIDNDKLQAFLKSGGYLRITKDNAGQYGIEHQVRLHGGGPLLAVCATVGTLVVGGVTTVAVAVATTAVAGPVAGFVAGAACAEATKDAAILVAVTTTAAPTP